MLKGRTVIILCSILAILLIAGNIIGSASPGNNNGKGKDSHGNRFYGFKAIFMILQKIGIQTERGYVPPSYLSETVSTIALLSPSRYIAAMDPQFVRDLRNWAEKGGRIVLAVKRPVTEKMQNIKTMNLQEQTFLSLLNMDWLKIKQYVAPEEETDSPAEIKKKRNMRTGRFTSEFLKNRELYNEYGRAQKCPIQASGNLKWVTRDCELVELPLHPYYIERKSLPASVKIRGELSISIDGEDYLLAASFATGIGEILVVSDPALFFNLYFSGKGTDNAVVATRLICGRYPGKILMDEFYHGLNIQGEAMWLLSKSPYNLITMFFFLAFALLAYRGYHRLGPPLILKPANRRSLHEYVAAMSHLLGRADTRRFVLQQLYDGGLWHIARKLEIRRTRLSAKHIAERMRKRNPGKADQIIKAAAHMEQLLDQPRINLKDALQAAEEMDQCL